MNLKKFKEKYNLNCNFHQINNTDNSNKSKNDEEVVIKNQTQKIINEDIVYDKENVGIYKWTNLNENKCYIGQSRCLKDRYKSFIKLKGRYAGEKINRIRAKSKICDWKYEILEYCSPEKLFEREWFYIKKYNSFKDEFGYNEPLFKVLKYSRISIQNRLIKEKNIYNLEKLQNQLSWIYDKEDEIYESLAPQKYYILKEMITDIHTKLDVIKPQEVNNSFIENIRYDIHDILKKLNSLLP